MDAANRNIHELRAKVGRVAAALEELEAVDAIIQPLIKEPLDFWIPRWFSYSANQTIWNTRSKLQTELTRLDLKLEGKIGATNKTNGEINRTANRNGLANGPTVYPELTDAELSVLETEIDYLIKEAKVLDNHPVFVIYPVFVRNPRPGFVQEKFNKAVKAGDVVVVHLLLRDPTIDPSTADNYAIRFASQNGHTDIVKMLLADPRVNPSADNNYAIRMASGNGQMGVVKVLLADSRVDPSARYNYAIKSASGNGHTDVVKMLLADPRVDPSVNDNYAICMASENGHLDIVKMLLADPRVDNNAALCCASENGHLDIVKILLADPRVNPSANNNAALRCASENGHLDVVRLLLERREVVARGLSREHIAAAKTAEIHELLRAKFYLILLRAQFFDEEIRELRRQEFNAVGGRRQSRTRTLRLTRTISNKCRS